MDKVWWDKYRFEVAEEFQGAKYSSNPIPINYGVTRLDKLKTPTFGNSGASAVAMAVAFGAKRVIMLGYDCQHTGGKTHWHGSHPKGLGDAGSVGKWLPKFRQLAQYAQPKAEVWNASRETALDMFSRKDLTECLALP